MAEGKHMGRALEASAPDARMDWRRVVACLAASVAIVALVCLVQVPKYAMPDDFMQDLYARGAYFDTPGFLMLYSLVAYSAPLSALYALVPAAPWYPLGLLVLIAVSFAVMASIALAADVRASLRAFLLCALALCEVMVTVYLTYTIVAFLAFAAGLALVLRRAAFVRPAGRPRASDALALALIVEGFSLRPESGVAALAVFAPFLVWAVARNRNLRTMLAAAGVLVAMGLSWAAGMLAWHLTPGWEGFEPTFSAARAIADYPRVDYADARRVAPELSENDVDMIYEFLFVDSDTYTLETFQALDGVVGGYGLDSLVSSVLARPAFTAYTAALLAVLAATAAYVCAGRGLRGGERALAFSVPVVVALEFAAIFLRARLKIHVFLPLFVVGLFALVVCCLAPAPSRARAEASRASVFLGRVVPVAGVIAYAGALLLLWASYVRPVQASLDSELTPAAEGYLAENPDQIALFTLTQGILTNDDIFGFDSWEQPENAVFVGGYEYYTPSWQTFLEGSGLSRDGFLANLVDNDGMVSVSYESQARMIETYLTEHTGSPVRAELVRTLGDTTQTEEGVAIWRYVS